MDWENLVKDLRKNLLLSQEEMAEKLGVAFCTLNRYENGHFEPSFKTQRKLKHLAKENDVCWDKYHDQAKTTRNH